MNKYELTVIVVNREVESLKEKVKGILVKNGVSITTEDHWGQRKLAYEIARESEGYYMFMNIEAPADSIEKIKKEFGLDANILRYLFVKLSEKASA